MNDEWWSLVKFGGTTSENAFKTSFLENGKSIGQFYLAYTQQIREKASAYQQVNFFDPEELGIGQVKISWYFPVFRVYN